jgi:hypothetical protein
VRNIEERSFFKDITQDKSELVGKTLEQIVHNAVFMGATGEKEIKKVKSKDQFNVILGLLEKKNLESIILEVDEYEELIILKQKPKITNFREDLFFNDLTSDNLEPDNYIHNFQHTKNDIIQARKKMFEFDKEVYINYYVPSSQSRKDLKEELDKNQNLLKEADIHGVLEIIKNKIKEADFVDKCLNITGNGGDKSFVEKNTAVRNLHSYIYSRELGKVGDYWTDDYYSWSKIK